MNTFLARVIDWFEYLSDKTSNTDSSDWKIDWSEIDQMRKRLVRMRFAKPSSASIYEKADERNADTRINSEQTSSLKASLTSTGLRRRDRDSILKWSGAKSSAGADIVSNYAADASGITVTKYGAPHSYSFANSSPNSSNYSEPLETDQPDLNALDLATRARLSAQRATMRHKLITTYDTMPAYDIDSQGVNELRRTQELESAMAELEESSGMNNLP